ALKAAQIALVAIDAQRETFRDDDTIRVHPIITRGGEAVSAVPADVRLETFVRGKTVEAIADAAAKVDRSLRAGAQAMGAKVEITTLPGYMPQEMDPNLVALTYRNAAAIVGEANMGRPRHSTGSTDVGDLGLIMPEVHPRAGGVKGTIHGVDYVVVDHRLAAVNPAKFMATTVVDLLHEGAREAGRGEGRAPREARHDEDLALLRRASPL